MSHIKLVFIETHSRIPRLKLCRQLRTEDVAPRKADPPLTGETTTMDGTPVETTFPFTSRQPSLMQGVAVTVIWGSLLDGFVSDKELFDAGVVVVL